MSLEQARVERDFALLRRQIQNLSQQIGEPNSGGPPFYVYAVDHGAKFDNIADDTTPMREAFAAAYEMYASSGTVVCPAGRAKITGNLTIGGTVGGTPTTSIGLLGAGINATSFEWNGPDDGIMFNLVRNKYFRMQGFAVNNPNGREATTGIALSGYGAGGTETLMGLIDHVRVSGFHDGISAGTGSPAVAASEFVYLMVELNSCDHGWINTDFNTLNHLFLHLNIGENDIGLMHNVGNVEIIGGSSYGNNIDFYSYGAVSFSLRQWRAEMDEGAVFVHARSRKILLENCETVGSEVDTIAVKIEADNRTVIRNCNFPNAPITLVANFATILLEDCFVSTSDFPLTNTYLGEDTQSGGNVTIRRCSNGDPVAFFPDQDGQFIFDTADATFKFISRIDYGRNIFSPQPLDYARLNRVHTLGFANRVEGHNLRVQGKFATAGTVAVTFVKGPHAVTAISGAVAEFAAGILDASDVGKTISAHRGSDNNTFTGEIKSVDLGTNRATFTALGYMGGDQTWDVTIGIDEPDANYFLFFGPNATEKIGWSNKATTGFTLTSDNATSTAIVDVFLVR